MTTGRVGLGVRVEDVCLRSNSGRSPVLGDPGRSDPNGTRRTVVDGRVGRGPTQRTPSAYIPVLQGWGRTGGPVSLYGRLSDRSG